MLTLLRRSRSLCALALATLALHGCAESDLEALHEQRLDDVLAAGGAPPDLGAARPTLGNGSTLDPEGYTLVLDEQFTGEALDETLWETALPWGPDFSIDGERQYYIDALGDPDFGHSPFTFDGDTLTISTIRTPEAFRARANEQPWLSGVLTTAGKFEFTHGYVEARVKFPSGQGVRPVLWMLGAEPGEPAPQLIVMEYDGARPDRLVHDYEYVGDAGELLSPGPFATFAEGLSEGFHTVSVSWTPEQFLFFVDGTPRYRIVGRDVSARDMYLVLGLAIGGGSVGASDTATPSPSTWVIDYVRVWQRRETAS